MVGSDLGICMGGADEDSVVAAEGAGECSVAVVEYALAGCMEGAGEGAVVVVEGAGEGSVAVVESALAGCVGGAGEDSVILVESALAGCMRGAGCAGGPVVTAKCRLVATPIFLFISTKFYE